MSLLSSLRIGQSGLRAASEGIRITSANVANASTEGYSRKSLETSTRSPIQRAGLWLGEGAAIDGISRSGDRLLTTRLLGAVGDQSSAETSAEALSGVFAGIYDADGDGLTEAYSAVFDALDAATSDPSDEAQRREVIAAAQVLTRRVRAAATSMDEGRQDQTEALETELASLNEDLATVAQLNEAIGASSNPLSAGDLMDQRDVVLRRLATGLGVEVDLDADGSATVMLGGHAIVSGEAWRELSVEADATTGELELRVATGNGTIDVTGETGGVLGGRLEALGAIEDASSTLAAWAVDFADAFNDQHALGFDSSGNAGGSVFTYTAGDEALTLDVSSTIVDDPSLLALAGAATASAGDGDNLALLAGQADGLLHDGGTRTGLESLTDFVSGLGTTVQALETEAESLGAVVDDLDTLVDAVSGVNLDDEALKLLELQAAYQAAARVLQTTDAMLGVLMEVPA